MEASFAMKAVVTQANSSGDQREVAIKHGRDPQGVTLLGMFLMPNKFFEANGSEVDFLGEDWNKKWAAANERKLNALFD